jgi:hypothetical protein
LLLSLPKNAFDFDDAGEQTLWSPLFVVMTSSPRWTRQHALSNPLRVGSSIVNAFESGID